MKKGTETIPFSDFEELKVNYQFQTDEWKEEPNLPNIQETITLLTSVILTLSGEPINILPLLSQKQKNDIINNLSYE